MLLLAFFGFFVVGGVMGTDEEEVVTADAAAAAAAAATAAAAAAVAFTSESESRLEIGVMGRMSTFTSASTELMSFGSGSVLIGFMSTSADIRSLQNKGSL